MRVVEDQPGCDGYETQDEGTQRPPMCFAPPVNLHGDDSQDERGKINHKCVVFGPYSAGDHDPTSKPILSHERGDGYNHKCLHGNVTVAARCVPHFEGNSADYKCGSSR